MPDSSSTSVHVAIVGAGVIGAMSAWRLARRGVRVTLFDRYAPAHDRGAAGGESRIFRVACKEGAAHVPLVRESLAMWRELESEAGQRLLYQTGAATIGAAHAPGMRAIRETSEQFGLRLEALARGVALERFPQFHLAPDEMMLFDPEGGALRSDLAVLSAVERAVELGASLRAYTRVDAIGSFDDHVELHVGDTRETFSHVVMAPGGWASFDPALAALPLVTRRISLCWFAPREPVRYDIEHSIVLMHLFERGYFYMFPSMDGATVKGSCNIGGWPAIDAPHALPRSLPDAELAHLRDAAAEVAPDLRRDPVRIGVYMDAYTPDGEGLLGCVPGAKGARTLVATGFSGHGFKFSPAIGEAVARLIVEGEAGRQAAHLDVARFREMPVSRAR